MIDDLARELIQAEVHRAPVAPLTQRYPELSMEQAYAIQARIAAWRIAQGQESIGKKIGYTNAEAQRAKAISEPMWAEAFPPQYDPEGRLPVGGLFAPRVEPEIAFLLGRDLKGPGVTPEQVIEATEALTPALEVLDSRYVEGRYNGLEGIADSGVHAALVVGHDRCSPRGLDLPAVVGSLEKNGREIGRGSGANVLGNPALAVAWLANKLAESGRFLRAGEFISSGTLQGAFSVQSGDELRLVIEGLGELRLRLS